MATSTTNLGLIKPDGTDKIRIAQINQNMDTLDTKIGAVGNTSLQSQVSENNAAIANLDTDTNSTNDILADALNCTKSKFFKGSGTAYTGEIPDSNYKYGVFHVDVRGTRKFVTGINTAGLTAVNAYDGSTWTGWQSTATFGKADISVTPSSSGNANVGSSVPSGRTLISAYSRSTGTDVVIVDTLRYSGNYYVNVHRVDGTAVTTEIPITICYI